MEHQVRTPCDPVTRHRFLMLLFQYRVLRDDAGSLKVRLKLPLKAPLILEKTRMRNLFQGSNERRDHFRPFVSRTCSLLRKLPSLVEEHMLEHIRAVIVQISVLLSRELAEPRFPSQHVSACSRSRSAFDGISRSSRRIARIGAER